MANPLFLLTAVAAGDAAEAQNLHHAVDEEGMAQQAGAHTAAAGEHVAPSALGLTDTGWVGMAALVVLIGMVAMKVPAMIGAMLDKRIADIRRQLDEAAQLRKEAEALREEYAAKARSAEADAAAMRENAHHEAQTIVAKAKADAEALMARRAKMAEDKIAAAERSAVAEVRARTAQATAAAAAALIAEHHDGAADKALVDKAIAGVGRLN